MRNTLAAILLTVAMAVSAADEVVLTGTVDAARLRAVTESNPTLRKLDLSGADMTGLPPYSLAATGIEEIILPDGLTTIGECALAGTGLRSLTLPASVVWIGAFALSGCPELTEVTGGSLRVIGEGAMRRCPKLASVEFGADLDSIGTSALRGTALREADLGGCSALRAIGAWALAGCTDLESVVLPAGIRYIGQGAFFGDSAITTMTMAGAPALIDDFAFAHARSLTEIDGEGMDAVPDLGTGVWHGMDQPEATLSVVASMLADFAATPGWQEFHIVAPSGIDSEPKAADEAAFSAVFAGSDLRVESSVELRSVAVYDTAGHIRLSVADPADPCVISAPQLQAGVYIVAATLSDGTIVARKAVRSH